MTNYSNTCYVNTVLHAVAALHAEERAFQDHSLLLDMCLNHALDSQLLSPTSLFALRALLPHWRFDGRQQDAAEFYTALTTGRGGDLQPVPWQGRTDGTVDAEDTFSPLNRGDSRWTSLSKRGTTTRTREVFSGRFRELVAWRRVPVRGKAGPHNKWAWPAPHQGQTCYTVQDYRSSFDQATKHSSQ